MPINEGITQKEIIDILLQKGSMEEPTLRREVKKALNLKDDSSIRVHISKLNGLECITKGNTQPGKANTWEISYDNLKHIVNKFPDMDFKENANVLHLIIQRVQQTYVPFLKTKKEAIERNSEAHFFSLMEFALKESESFFKASITTDFEELRYRWSQLYEIKMKDADPHTYMMYEDMLLNDCLPDFFLLHEAIENYIRCDILNGVVTMKGYLYATREPIEESSGQ